MSGVPAEQVTATDFIMVRAALVKTLGGANNALVWARIHFRCAGPHTELLVTDSVGRWWPASHAVLAEETGLTPNQVRRALDQLLDDGYLIHTEHRQAGNYDRTRSYRPVIEGGHIEVANLPHEWVTSTRESRHMEVANPPLLPLPQTVSTDVDTSLVGTSGPDQVSADATRLCDLLVELMVENGNRRPTPGKKWHDAARRLLKNDEVPFDLAKRVLIWSQRDEFWQTNIHSMPTFRAQFDKLRARAALSTPANPGGRPGLPGRPPLTNAERAIALANSIPEGATHGTQTDRPAVGQSLRDR